MKHEHTFTLDWSLEETNFAIEPCSRLFGGPFVLDSERQLHSATTVTLHMKINAPKLCLHNSSVNVHLLWMKMKLIPLGEAIGRGETSEAVHHPKIF
jgi:hypothetical protein